MNTYKSLVNSQDFGIRFDLHLKYNLQIDWTGYL